jgi:hypothetical protein
VRRHGMGDVQFTACVRGLGPLVELAGGELTTEEIAITERGRDVTDGHVDWLSLTALDTWLGGVHLRPGAPLWRWDGARGRLAASAV